MIKSFDRYNDEFNAAAVQHVRDGKSVREVAEASNVDNTTLYDWCHEAGVKFQRAHQFTEEFRIAVVRELEEGCSDRRLRAELE